MYDHRMTWFFVEKWGKVSRAILRSMFPKKISQTRGLSSGFQTVLHRVSKSWKASHGPWWGQGRVVRGEPVRGFSPLLRLLTSTVLLLYILCIKNMLSIFRFLCNIALYSIGPCFYHQSHPQLGIFFFLLWLHPFILSGVIFPLISSGILGTYWPVDFLFQYPIILPFHTVHGVLKARTLKWFAIKIV